MVEIESFEPYHIGIKLQPHVNLEILGNKLRRMLKEKGYEVAEKSVSEMSIPILPPKEVLGLKNGVRVEFNLVANALNTIGSEPVKVIRNFKEVVQILSGLDYSLKETIAFYEILATIIVRTEKHPRLMINNSVRIDLASFREVGEIVVDSVRIVNVEPTEEQGSIRLTIEPNPTSPNSRYLVKIQFRSFSPEGIESFQNEMEKRILSVVQSIEGE
ncbi:MAG: hypothetical protein AOA66_1598 [Candidatus Bathyarchaeota archaeon BA2]|nr:MAG: hypothetical protein AOA66_1598 [Candidatus Bathyarchaeota archaeon BA2]